MKNIGKTLIRTAAVLIGMMWIIQGLLSLFVDEPIFEPKVHALFIILLGAYCLACGVAGKRLYRIREK